MYLESLDHAGYPMELLNGKVDNRFVATSSTFKPCTLIDNVAINLPSGDHRGDHTASDPGTEALWFSDRYNFDYIGSKLREIAEISPSLSPIEYRYRICRAFQDFSEA